MDDDDLTELTYFQLTYRRWERKSLFMGERGHVTADTNGCKSHDIIPYISIFSSETNSIYNTWVADLEVASGRG